MKKTLLLIPLMLFAAYAQCQDAALPPRLIKTTDGQSFEKATITSQDAETVSISYDAGIAKVRKDSLPVDIQKEIGFITKEQQKVLDLAAAVNKDKQDAAADKEKREGFEKEKATQEYANSFFKISRAGLLVRLGKPDSITTGNDADGRFETYNYGKTTYFTLWVNDTTFANSCVKGFPVMNPAIDPKVVSDRYFSALKAQNQHNEDTKNATKVIIVNP